MYEKMEKYFDQYKILDKFLIVTIKNWIIKNKSLIVSTNFWNRTFDFVVSIYLGVIALYFLIIIIVKNYQRTSLKNRQLLDTYTYPILGGLIFFSILISAVSYLWILPKSRKWIDFKFTLPRKKHSVQFFVVVGLILPFIMCMVGWPYLLSELYKYNSTFYWEISEYNVPSFFFPLFTGSIAIVTYFNSKHPNLSIIVNSSTSMLHSNYVSVIVEKRIVLEIWCNNTGGRAGTFKFVGIVSSATLRKINKEHRVNNKPILLGDYLRIDNSWKKLDSGEKGFSNLVSIDENNLDIINQFIYVLYVDSEQIPYFYGIYIDGDS